MVAAENSAWVQCAAELQSGTEGDQNISAARQQVAMQHEVSDRPRKQQS